MTMAQDREPKVCLDIAIDHRLRLLFKPVPESLTAHSNHVSRIKLRGQSLDRSPDEIEVTAQLAGPETKGGIAIALQQPRNNHPFNNGIDTVIEDCETLFALYDIFTAVSCRTLDIKRDITIIDLLPFISERVAQIDDIVLKESFSTSMKAICDKEPDVLLCAGKVRLPKAGGNNSHKGDAWKFESIGVGMRFGNGARTPTNVRIRHGDRGLISIRKVNGFHPSYAMNYHPHVSLLRQLQILIGAEVCGMLRGDWEEEEWMDGLRSRAKDFSDSVSVASPSNSPGWQNRRESLASRKTTKYFSDYQVLYSDALIDLEKACVKLMLLDSGLADISPKAFYETLRSSALSEKCNDVSLLLRQMCRLQQQGWPKSVAWKNEAAMKAAIDSTVFFYRNIIRAKANTNDSQLVKLIRHCARACQKHTARSGDEIDLVEIGDAFLSLATEVETLLLDLFLRKKEEALILDEGLSDMMGKMRLGPAAVTVTTVSPLPESIGKPHWWSRGRRS